MADRGHCQKIVIFRIFKVTLLEGKTFNRKFQRGNPYLCPEKHAGSGWKSLRVLSFDILDPENQLYFVTDTTIRLEACCTGKTGRQ